jgi:NADH-quinone oxidoreductase subunit L
MFDWIETNPGRLYVVATLLPLTSFALLLLVGGVRALCRPFRSTPGTASSLYWLCGGDRPLKTGAYFATGMMAVAAAIAVAGLVMFLKDSGKSLDTHHGDSKWAERMDWVRIGSVNSAAPKEWDKQTAADENRVVPQTALALELGYKIDHLTALLFAMVTVIGTGIFVFSLGYMKDETQEIVDDHEVDKQTGEPVASATGVSHDSHDHHHTPAVHAAGSPGHFVRRGRYGRFFLFLSLFCFSMLNLLIADNLFQVFVSWELVGVCSFFLIGFYYERPSASRAANKAFIVNRIGDAGFLVGIMLAWSYLGTLNFEEMTQRVRSPERDTHGKLELANQIIRVNVDKDRFPDEDPGYRLPPQEQQKTGTHIALFPLLWDPPDHYHGLGYNKKNHNLAGFTVPPKPTLFDFGAMPYWLFVLMGIGIFLGCVGKSAQVPLQTWLPDAMEGPTPVSALIHAATMVAAGVYLVGRAYPLFAPEVLLVIAYIGAITLFISATIALVQTDIKRVLAYSTCSQLGYMMLALGVGGWVAGLMHLITHAFFKALLFLGSGSVIHGCHHEQDLRKMGGLFGKMKITAITMLIGVLAICGAPLFSGWYSKDAIIGQALGFGLFQKDFGHPEHVILFLLPLITAGMTGFYMFRLWFLAFAGKPRDEHVNEHAHESPWLMTLPLIVLAVFSIGVAWGSPIWDAEKSYLGDALFMAEPHSVEVEFHGETHEAHEHHQEAGLFALGAAALGVGLACIMYWKPKIDPAAIRAVLGGPYKFFLNKWYFDEAYDAAFVKPTVALAFAAAAADKRPTDAPPPAGESELPPRRFDLLTLDGWLNGIGQSAGAVGGQLRGLQTGRLRSYILLLALTVVLMLGILSVLT